MHASPWYLVIGCTVDIPTIIDEKSKMKNSGGPCLDMSSAIERAGLPAKPI